MKRKCDDCGEEFKNKKDLINHLILKLEDVDRIMSYCIFQLEELGIKNPYL